LSKKVFDKNLQDFRRCEDKWEVKDYITEEFLKKNFGFVVGVLQSTDPNKSIDYYKWEYIKDLLEKGRVVEDPFMLYRVKSDLPRCPLCGGTYNEATHEYSISRRDNKTKICPQCGIDEAFQDLFDERG